MRWGVRNEATVDHSAGALCMAEIDNCIKYSVGPTFVVRYALCSTRIIFTYFVENGINSC